MATHIPATSVWQAMSYTPPRGKCNFKSGLMSGTCSCLRFMLHPVKAATSFECDGCSHHASFHLMENPEENAIIERWANAEENRETALVPLGRRVNVGNASEGTSGGAGTKRRRVANGES
ncbi:hypothetical protein BDZ85DRAFT_96739 [Elsinoe ampelina]|uniref:Uncharacterized protein n=1 Tax=Elsinoe ampelina TaxID=302913 RepID=A0A6A6GED8_9PEZI|nr:hypothetical protein BDZ85DRAFT_96739 [Elsinoe ampelina]